jgi:1-acyl-sn-glycerol-3-phosphate acyltransferase
MDNIVKKLIKKVIITFAVIILICVALYCFSIIPLWMAILTPILMIGAMIVHVGAVFSVRVKNSEPPQEKTNPESES